MSDRKSQPFIRSIRSAFSKAKRNADDTGSFIAHTGAAAEKAADVYDEALLSNVKANHRRELHKAWTERDIARRERDELRETNKILSSRLAAAEQALARQRER